MAIYTFTQDGIDYNNVLSINSEIYSSPLSLKDNYTVSGTNIESIHSQHVFNVIDVNWNGALLPDAYGSYTIRINTTSDLLSYIKQLIDDYKTLAQ